MTAAVRVILDNAFSEWGGWNYNRNHQDSFRDIERTFLTLDGKRTPEGYASIVQLVQDRRSAAGHHPAQAEIENDYFLIRCYKNGNAHIWFKRDDLLRKVNLLLAEYYGEVVPDASDDRAEQAADDAALNNRKTGVAKNYGFYPTPDRATNEVYERLPTYREEGKPRLRLLEPSAGTGNLARRAVEKGCIVDCVELHGERADALRAEGLYRNVHCGDFLAILPPAADSKYDRIAMNPPYFRGAEIDHVLHALEFLADDGCLVAILPAGIEFRSDRKTTAFRERMAKMNAQYYDLPAGTFAEVGTNINTMLLKVWADGRKFYRY